jgi:hypothetical protein
MIQNPHPETAERLEQLRETFVEDGEFALTSVERTLRDLVNGLASSALSRFIPAGPVTGSSVTHLADASGRRFEVTLEADESRGGHPVVTATLGVHEPRSWDRNRVAEVASVHSFDHGGKRPRLSGAMRTDEAENLFAFTAANFPAVEGHVADEPLGLPFGEDLDEAIAADGGVPGARSRELLATFLEATRVEVMKVAAGHVEGIARAQRELGLEWGKAFLAYDDCDKRCTSVPRADGRTAIFHENIDLCADHSAYLASIETGEDGKPASVEVWLVYRYAGSLPDAVAAFAAGEAPPENVVRFALDLETGVLEQPSDLEGYGMESTLWHGISRDLDVVAALGLGELELGGYNKVETGFDTFERDGDDEDEDDLDDDEEVAPKP